MKVKVSCRCGQGYSVKLLLLERFVKENSESAKNMAEQAAAGGFQEETDEYEHYNYEQDKLTGHGGKGRTKKESAQHHVKDPSRKAPTVIANAEEKRKKEAKEKQSK